MDNLREPLLDATASAPPLHARTLFPGIEAPGSAPHVLDQTVEGIASIPGTQPSVADQAAHGIQNRTPTVEDIPCCVPAPNARRSLGESDLAVLVNNTTDSVTGVLDRAAERAREQAEQLSQRLTGAADWMSLRLTGATSSQNQHESSTMPVVFGMPPPPTQNIIYVSPYNAVVETDFPRFSIRTTCPHCHTTSDTRLKYVAGWKAHVLTFLLFWCIGFFAFFVYCFHEAKVVCHYCRHCNSLLGRTSPSWTRLVAKFIGILIIVSICWYCFLADSGKHHLKHNKHYYINDFAAPSQ